MKSEEMTLSARLKCIRSSLGLSQREFASGANMSIGLLRDNEQGISNVTDKTIRKICNAYSVNENWLRSGDGRMFVDTRLDAFEQFAAAFNLDADQQTRIAEIIQFPIGDTQKEQSTRLDAARILKAVNRGSIGRVANV